MNDFVYLQNGIAGNPPTLIIGSRKVPLTEGTCLLWIKILVEFIRERGLRENVDCTKA